MSLELADTRGTDTTRDSIPTRLVVTWGRCSEHLCPITSVLAAPTPRVAPSSSSSSSRSHWRAMHRESHSGIVNRFAPGCSRCEPVPNRVFETWRSTPAPYVSFLRPFYVISLSFFCFLLFHFFCLIFLAEE